MGLARRLFDVFALFIRILKERLLLCSFEFLAGVLPDLLVNYFLVILLVKMQNEIPHHESEHSIQQLEVHAFQKLPHDAVVKLNLLGHLAEERVIRILALEEMGDQLSVTQLEGSHRAFGAEQKVENGGCQESSILALGVEMELDDIGELKQRLASLQLVQVFRSVAPELDGEPLLQEVRKLGVDEVVPLEAHQNHHFVNRLHGHDVGSNCAPENGDLSLQHQLMNLVPVEQLVPRQK